MSSATTTRTDAAANGTLRRRSSKTKAAFKTTEFIAYVVITVSVLITSLVVDGNGNGDNGAGGDYSGPPGSTSCC